ncbi:MAG: hypothetical protein CSA76_04085 [Spirochaetales bacterium]|nr:MAG: hypothetical protein CSA76_04085 [Spirochaetales bacterium]
MENYSYENHLYMICHPNPALVGSQLPPAQFAQHYIAGSTRFFEGKFLFAEIDINFRAPYFDIDRGIKGLVPHTGGEPKSTKFICNYRVLEHIDFKAIQTLYLANPDGSCFGLKSAPYDRTHQPDFLRIFSEITPLRMLVLSSYDFSQYGKWITDPSNPKGAPKMLYTQFELNIEDFLADFEANPFMPMTIPGVHPSRLRDAIFELRDKTSKHTKGLSLDVSSSKKSYRLVRHGFMFASATEELFFPMPPLDQIEKENYKFWRSM